MVRGVGGCGQSLSAYVFLVLTIGAALIGMQTYIRRALQAKIRDMFVCCGYSKQSVERVDDEDINLDINTNEISNVSVRQDSWVNIENKRIEFGGKTTQIQLDKGIRHEEKE